MKIDKFTATLIVIIIMLIVCLFISTSSNTNDSDPYAKQKQKIDSLTIHIAALEEIQLKYDNTIAIYRDSLSLMDSQIDSTKNKIKKIQNDYGKKIKVISSANHDELSDFFTNRYK
jgi:vacuolar-type H+-ATPase subunit I/STV1